MHIRTATNYRRVGEALRWLAANHASQPSLAATAAHVGLSPAHFQRVFTAHVGVSPKRFLAKLALDHAKASLTRRASVLDASFDAGLSGPGRLHDLFVAHEAMTPGQWKDAAAGMTVRYGWHDSPFGDCLVAAVGERVCGLGFADPLRSRASAAGGAAAWGGRDAVFADLMDPYGAARLVEDGGGTRALAAAAFGPARGDLRLLLRATPFQLKVWEALLRIPAGTVATYGDVARAIGAPAATRAAASAVARNQVAWLIPCHRVLRAEGALGGYRWDTGRKRLMLAWEAAREDEGAAVA